MMLWLKSYILIEIKNFLKTIINIDVTSISRNILFLDSHIHGNDIIK